MADYWNHNTAYHPWLYSIAAEHHGDVLDVGCGDGLLRPAGEIAVVGISANRTGRDWLRSAACLPAVRIGSWLQRETSDIGVPVTQPRESLDEIRRVVGDVLPGADIRRGLYYRYLLRWRNCQVADGPGSVG